MAIHESVSGRSPKYEPEQTYNADHAQFQDSDDSQR